jgi:hypothetical protein
MWEFFLESVINDRVAVSEKLLCHKRMRNFVMCHHKHSICAFLTIFVVALGHSPKVPAKHCLPDVLCCRFVHYFFVTGNHLTCDWVHHRACIMLVFDRHFGVLHEGLRCVLCAEGCLLSQGKCVNCALPTWLHHLHLHLHSCGTSESDRGIGVLILCYGWD